MFNPQQTVGNDTIKSDIHCLTEQFLNGEVLAEQLSDYVLGNIARLREGTYIQYVERIKQILSHSKIDYHYDLMIIKSSAEIAEDEKAVMVRFINLCVAHRAKIVVYNNNVIYVPEKLKKFGTDVLDAHINSAYRDYTTKRKIKAFARRFSFKKFIPFLH